MLEPTNATCLFFLSERRWRGAGGPPLDGRWSETHLHRCSSLGVTVDGMDPGRNGIGGCWMGPPIYKQWIQLREVAGSHDTFQVVQDDFLGGGFKYVLFSSLFGEDSHFDSYFSDGLKPPTSTPWISVIWKIYKKLNGCFRFSLRGLSLFVTKKGR